MKNYSSIFSYLFQNKYYTKQCTKRLKYICDEDNTFFYSISALQGHLNYIENTGYLISKLILKNSNSVLDTGDFILLNDDIQIIKDKKRELYTLKIKLDLFDNYYESGYFENIKQICEYMQFKYLKNFEYLFVENGENKYKLFSINRI